MEVASFLFDHLSVLNKISAANDRREAAGPAHPSGTPALRMPS
jgi:hypothetical protein